MSDRKGWGSTVLGWFVVQDGQRPDATTVDDASSAVANAALEGTFSKDVPAAKGGRVDFEAVFDAAGIDADLRSHCAKAAQLLENLPAQADQAVKKQIVEASL